ncbi:MAG: 16S rRNA (guanine(527)-N(7))-methyltransferase RsmG [Bdellovibrionales bacterium]|nr:16S rRNA (guanine(527)-N(7))-methyltransferase RsmG [Bdellovibrionales bacterium]
MSFKSELQSALTQQFSELNSAQIEGILTFAESLYKENQKQNLTRIEGVQDFIDGHLVDVLELFKLPGGIGNRIVDIGSGSGVPGLLAAAIDTQNNREWHLIESETHKADYLSNSAQKMGLKNVFVYAARVEDVIQDILPETVMARAVGKIEKISAWIWKCSTWNNLVLFKSRGWESEWKEAQLTKFGKKLTVIQTLEYSVEDKYRIIVKLTRA